MVLGNMLKEDQDMSVEEQDIESETEGVRGDGRCVDALKSRRKSKENDTKEEGTAKTNKRNVKNFRFSEIQTEARPIKEEEDTPMSGVTEKTDEEGEPTETAEEDEIGDGKTSRKLRWRFSNFQTEAIPEREEEDTQMSGATEKKEEEGGQMEVETERATTPKKKRRKVVADSERENDGFWTLSYEHIWRSVAI